MGIRHLGSVSVKVGSMKKFSSISVRLRQYEAVRNIKCEAV